MELSKTFHFEASHVLRHHKGQCANLHGHSWILTIYVRGPVDRSNGMVQDYADIKAAAQPIIDDMDHAHLGVWKTDKIEITIPHPTGDMYMGTKYVSWLPSFSVEFEPTSENLLIEIAKQLVKRSLVFSRLTLNETCTVSCSLTWEEFNASRR